MGDTRDTERPDARFAGFEGWSSDEMIEALLGGQARAVEAVQRAGPALAAAVERATNVLEHSQGRLVYVGAGTSGRLAVQDGVELLPTFGWPQERCVYLMAGGETGLFQSIEGAEDEESEAVRMIKDAGVDAKDVVIGLAASGSTPFTRAALRQAKAQSALTIGFANNPGAPLLEEAEIGILLDSGPEVLAGSTRLGSGNGAKGRTWGVLNSVDGAVGQSLSGPDGRCSGIKCQIESPRCKDGR